MIVVSPAKKTPSIPPSIPNERNSVGSIMDKMKAPRFRAGRRQVTAQNAADVLSFRAAERPLRRLASGAQRIVIVLPAGGSAGLAPSAPTAPIVNAQPSAMASQRQSASVNGKSNT